MPDASRPARLLVACMLALLLGLPVAFAAVPDPTRPAITLPPPAAAPATAAPALVLQSTLIAPGQSSAIINGQRLRRGDRIGEARLVAIGPGWVRLETAAGTTELRLSHSSLLRPVNR
ncbi:MAG: hypothetical protein KGZ52_11820 [Xanthomonadaceae bacterium]|nr:hypothetical protein [Xanthomonadaceae bacterium]